MTQPEEIHDSEGKWARRDVFLEEFKEDHKSEEVEEAIDELIEDGTMRQKRIGDDQYIQLESTTAGLKQLVKGKTQAAKGKAYRFLNR